MDNADAERQELVRVLTALPAETEWVEFKENYSEPDAIGTYLSALANSATLHERDRAYLLWGVRDDDHAVVGTSFDPFRAKKGGEGLINWLTRLLDPKIGFDFFVLDQDGVRVVLLEISPATHRPIAFSGVEHIRVGSHVKRLRECSDHERRLWRHFERTNFESGTATPGVSSSEVRRLLDVDAYFRLLDMLQPDDPAGVLATLADDGVLTRTDSGRWNITNQGAILFARNLDDFRWLRRKKVRIVRYRGRDRVHTIHEEEIPFGYAVGFDAAVRYLNQTLPSNEVIGVALRQTVRMFPELAVRELLANMLIHQDFSLSGTGPMVEIFEDRLEISNPGNPLVDTWRFVDAAPRSRNEHLAAAMRRMGICEERGTGWDKIAGQIEVFQLPAPVIDVGQDSTRIVLFGHRDLADMDRTDRVRAVYLHAVLRWVLHQTVTNTSVRERFKIADSDTPQASRIIREALADRVIAVRDPEASRRYREYVPFWAARPAT